VLTLFALEMQSIFSALSNMKGFLYIAQIKIITAGSAAIYSKLWYY